MTLPGPRPGQGAEQLLRWSGVAAAGVEEEGPGDDDRARAGSGLVSEVRDSAARVSLSGSASVVACCLTSSLLLGDTQ